MNQSDDIRKTQKSFARKAQAEPKHRFQDLWHILCREDWIKSALVRTLASIGARTTGVDGMSKSDLKSGTQQTDFIKSLRSELKSGHYQPMPVRRASIHKPGKSDKHPLGAPTIKDRVVQELLRMLMEPIWESDFLDCSNGFRPGRTTMDCIAVCCSRIQKRTKYDWVIEGDMRRCIDRIHHKKLVGLVRRRIADQRVIQLIDAFLKAGVMEDGLFQETPAGIRQGGILSPLLANIYLHELDRWWWEKYGSLSLSEKARRRKREEGSFILTRYAADFIVLCSGAKESARQFEQEMKSFLGQELHLELSEGDTQITHVTGGFDFLGFHIQRAEPKDHRSWLRVTPAHESQQRLRDTIRKMTDRALAWEPVPDKIQAINRVLRGWGYYYRHVTSSLSRGRLDWYVSQRMLKWLCERHKGMGRRSILKKYYIRQGERKNWGCKDGQAIVHLFRLRDIQHRSCPRRKPANPYLKDDTVPDSDFNRPHIGTRDRAASRSKAGGKEAGNQALTRDNHCCTQCGSPEESAIHDVKAGGGIRPGNPQTLCQECHEKTPSYGVSGKPKQNGM